MVLSTAKTFSKYTSLRRIRVLLSGATLISITVVSDSICLKHSKMTSTIIR